MWGYLFAFLHNKFNLILPQKFCQYIQERERYRNEMRRLCCDDDAQDERTKRFDNILFIIIIVVILYLIKVTSLCISQVLIKSI